MKTRSTTTFFLFCAFWVWAAFGTVTAMAATEQQKLSAVNQGLAYLYSIQEADGSWRYYGPNSPNSADQAATGAAVLAFMSQKDKWTDAVQYQSAVDKAVNYLLGVAEKTTVSTRNDGVNICPGGSGSCVGIHWSGSSYITGLVAPALMTYAADRVDTVATTSGPLANLTWLQIAQGIVNTWAASQSTAKQGNRIGGWRYEISRQGYDSDMSTTQWGIISLIYTQTLGVTVPAIIKTDLAKWLAFVQDSSSGAGCYDGSSYCNHNNTGGMLLGLKFLGYDLSNTHVLKALNFLNTNWQQRVVSHYGNFSHPYAMWSVFKGLEANIGVHNNNVITNLLTTCGAPNNRPGNPPGSVPCNWWEDYNEWIVNHQNSDGSWNGYGYWYSTLATAFYISMLGPTYVPISVLSIDVRHHLPVSGYLPDTATILPAANSVSDSEIAWQARIWGNQPTSRTFQLTGLVSNLAPGESRAISTGTDITATFTDLNGQMTTVTLPLPPVVIAAAHILTLDPPSRTVVAGQSVSYTLTLANPTSTSQTYTLGLVGLEGLNATLAGAVTVPASQTVTTPLVVGPSASIPTTTRAFAVTATTATGGVSTAPGEVLITNIGLGTGAPPPTVQLPGQAVDIALSPTTAPAGQGTAATYTVKITNLGNETTTYDLTGAFPPGFTAQFGETRVTLLPGLSNYRNVTLKLTPAPGTATGSQNFAVTATAANNATVKDQASGKVNVLGLGVDVALTPTTPSASDRFNLRVTNTGQVQETYDLALAGPVALYATLPTEAVTLAPGASQVISLTVSPITVALPGALNLTAVATAHSNTAVQDSDTAALIIPTQHGLTAHFDPKLQVLPQPGPASFAMQVQNTGNVEEAYQAWITDLDGPVSASLSGLDGQPTPRIEVFRLPPLATGLLTLNTALSDAGTGTVTVAVKALNPPPLQAADSATVQAEPTQADNQRPVADAGDHSAITVNHPVNLDGGRSHDPDNGPQPLRYQWTFVTLPANSRLQSADLLSADTARPQFTPDVSGEYRLQLTVSDGDLSASAQVTVQATNNPPVAVAGPDLNLKLGTVATLDGGDSFDPDGQLIHYVWRLIRKPDGSRLTDADLQGADTPTPRFTPDVAGQHQLELKVRDTELESEPDAVQVTAFAGNVPPNARAGANQTALIGNLVQLDGGASHDADQGPGSLTYLWTLAQRPTGSQLTNASIVDATLPKANFTPDAPGDYVLNLQVADGQDSDHAQVTITSLLANVPPNAVAGPAQQLSLGATASLDGTASADPDNSPDPLTFSWRFVFLPEGSRLSDAALTNAQSAKPSFIPDVVGDYVVRLEVSDGQSASGDNVLVTVTALPPITALSARAKDSKIEILWTPVAEAVSYNIFRSATIGGPYTLIQQGHVTNYAAFADFGLTNGVKYCYVVRWVNASGQESSDSNEACATPTGRPRR